MAVLFMHGIHELTKEELDAFYEEVPPYAFHANSPDSSRHTSGKDVPRLNDASAHSSGFIVHLDATRTELFLGIAILPFDSSFVDYGRVLFVEDDAGNLLFRLFFDESDMTMKVLDANDTVVLTGNGWTEDNWSAVALHVVISDTAGRIALYIGAAIDAEADGIDTGTTPIGRAGWSPSMEGNNRNSAHEDFWIDDANAHPDARVASLRPTADGAHQDWPRGDDTQAAWSQVNGGATSHIYSDTDLERSTFDVEAVPSHGDRPVITAVAAVSASTRTDAQDWDLALTTRIGTSDYDSAFNTVGPSKAYEGIWEDNPDTGAAWTDADVDGAEFGVVSGGAAA